MYIYIYSYICICIYGGGDAAGGAQARNSGQAQP